MCIRLMHESIPSNVYFLHCIKPAILFVDAYFLSKVRKLFPIGGSLCTHRDVTFHVK